ncbi:MAG: ATP-binding protein [Melioribacteraceae bacterium]|nr:ATP-binding protein [Melioribacteraceae bacterium]
MNKQLTYFDRPERLGIDDILTDYTSLKEIQIIQKLIDSMPELVLLINDFRQIVAFNNKAIALLEPKSIYEVIGKRLGEAIKCIHSSDMEAGCGTSKFCAECGAAKANLNTITNRVSSLEECKITSKQKDRLVSFDLLVNTSPIIIEGKNYTIFAIRDISNEKRREALEKIFFHDVLNTAGAIHGLTKLLSELENPEEKEEISNAIVSSSEQLLGEILSQRELRNAEDGNLAVDIKEISANAIIQNIYELYSKHELARGKVINLNYCREDSLFHSDSTLLIRSLGNLVKNALEAVHNGDIVNIYYEVDDKDIHFHVKNNKFIPENIQLQLFQRSFSTSGKKGRGIGLYSVKMIIENYLKGKASFTTDKDAGTIFTISMPQGTDHIE